MADFAFRYKQHMERGGSPDDFRGRATTATRRWARKKGMELNQEYTRERGATASTKAGRFSDNDDKILLSHRDKGFSAAEIGEKMGISRNSVIGRLNRLKTKSQEGEETAAPVKQKPSLPRLKFLEQPFEE